MCKNIYKIVAKIIEIRIKVLHSTNISGEKFGFHSGKQIHEAIGVDQKGLHMIKIKNMRFFWVRTTDIMKYVVFMNYRK